ncbi:hypothetical protein QYE76_045336 [Lolium multiflorum]|uniref:Uncharacterized protein n=1 Tax=Lolium multiflorum TaxID=4521 RepID=A0AAD8TMT0_LOLMU|nr:hypothetical protein QYE76_045336 [Lolium multiflorum]
MRTTRPEIQNSVHLEALRAVSQQRLEALKRKFAESAHGNRASSPACFIPRELVKALLFATHKNCGPRSGQSFVDGLPREAWSPESIN